MKKVYEVIKDEEVDEYLKQIEDTIAEEYDNNPKFAERADAYLEYLNRTWILNNKGNKVNINGTEIDIEYYLAAKKMMEINDIELDEDTYLTISDAVVKYYQDINEENVMTINNDIPIEINGRHGKLNTMGNLEYYIADLDPDYVDLIDDKLVTLYDDFDRHYGTSEQSAEQETVNEPDDSVVEPDDSVVEPDDSVVEPDDSVVEPDEFEEEDNRNIGETEQLKEISLDELVVALDNYSVVNHKLVKVR